MNALGYRKWLACTVLFLLGCGVSEDASGPASTPKFKNKERRLTTDATRVSPVPLDKAAEQEWLDSEAPHPEFKETELRSGEPYRDKDIVSVVAYLTGASARGAIREMGIWNEGGQFVFLPGPQGALKKLRVADWRIIASLDVGEPIQGMAASQEGLMLARSQDVLLVDPVSLECRGRIQIEGVRPMAAAPNCSTAYFYSGEAFYVVDLAERCVIHRVPRHAVDSSVPGFGKRGVVWQMQVTADGRFLIVNCNGVRRYRIDGTELHWQENTLEFGSHSRGQMCVSQDGYVAICTGITGAAAVETEWSRQVRVFSVEDLATPEAIIETFGHAVGIDNVSGDILLDGMDGFQRYSRTGKLIGKYNELGSDLFLPHPTKSCMFTFGTSTEIRLMELD